MHPGSGGPADQQGLCHFPAFHFMRHMHHFVQRRGDESAEADNIRVFLTGSVQDFIRGYHYAEVNNIISITTEYHAHDIFTNIMYVAFNRGQ